MNYKKSSEIQENLIDKIISVAYGHGSFMDRLRVKRMIKNDNELKGLFEEYHKTAKTVHSLKFNESEKTNEFKSKQKSRTIIEDLYSIFLGKPIIYSTVVTMLFASIMFSVFTEREISLNGYSNIEVEKANLESKYAISIVAKIFKKTESTLKTDILYKEVSKPIINGMNTVNNLFNKEIEK